jgi:excisionase family DNA binding protein
MKDVERLTINLWPDAGKALGIGKNQAYEAARHGQIPSIRLGKRIVVPKAAFQKLLEGKTNE